MKPFDPVILGRIQDRLAVLDDLGRRREAALRGEVGARSPAALDAELPDGRFVKIYAAHATTSALDHLMAVRAIVHARYIPIAGQVSLLRVAIENADRCRWLVDAKLRPEKRVGRGIAARRDDQEQRALYEAAPGEGPISRPGPRGKTGAERMVELDAAGRAHQEAGILTGGYGDATSVTRAFGHERWYRLASGVSHGKEWVLTYVARLRPETRVAIDAGTGGGRFTVDEAFTEKLVDVAVAAAESAITSLEEYVRTRPTRRRIRG